MLTLKQITAAIRAQCGAALADTAYKDVPFLAADVSEPIVRPSIKIMLEDAQGGLFNANCRERTLTYRLYFFAADPYNYRLDNLAMQEVVECAFLGGLTAEGAHIPIASIESAVTDTVLVCSMDIYAVELLPETETEIIEELQFKEKIND